MYFAIMTGFRHFLTLLLSQKILGAKIPLSQSQIEFSRAGWREETNTNVMTSVKSNVHAKIKNHPVKGRSVFHTRQHFWNKDIQQKVRGSNMVSSRFIAQKRQFELIHQISLHTTCYHPLPFPII